MIAFSTPSYQAGYSQEVNNKDKKSKAGIYHNCCKNKSLIILKFTFVGFISLL